MKKVIILFLVLCGFAGNSLSGQDTPGILLYDWGKPVFEESQAAARDTMPAHVLQSNTVMEFIYNPEGDLEGYTLFHEKIKINNNNGLEAFNTLRFNLRATNEMLTLKARFIGKDGKVIELSKNDLRTVEQEDGNSYKLLAIEGAETGGIIEYYWIRKGIRNLFGNYFVQGGLPRKTQNFTIISPMNLQFMAQSYNGCPAMTETVDSLKQQRIFTLLAADVPALEKEKHTFYDSHLQRVEYTLAYNHSKGKNRVYGWENAIQAVFSNTSSFSEKDLKLMKPVWKKMPVKNNMKNEEKVLQIENYIKTHFQLLEDPVPGKNLSGFEDIISTHYASKLGYVRLLTASFHQFNIPFELLITCDRTDRVFDPAFDAYNFLDDYLIYFPGFDEFLDPNNMFNRLGIIGDKYLGNYALFLKPLSASGVSSYMPYTKQIPVNNYKKSLHTTKSTMKIEPDFSASYTCQHSFTGYTADFIQPLLYYAEEDVKENFMKTIMPDESDKLGYWKISNQEPLDWFVKPLTVTLQASGTALVFRGGDDIIVKIGELIGRQEEMYQQTVRKLPIEDRYTRSYTREIIFEIPEGYKVSNPENLIIKKELIIEGEIQAFFYSGYTINGNRLIVTSTEDYKQSSFPVSIYKEYAGVINAAADFNKVSVILTPVEK